MVHKVEMATTILVLVATVVESGDLGEVPFGGTYHTSRQGRGPPLWDDTKKHTAL